MTWRGLCRGGPWWAVLLVVASAVFTWASLSQAPLGAPSPAWSSTAVPLVVVARTAPRWWPPLLVLVAGAVAVPHLLVGDSPEMTTAVTLGSVLTVLVSAIVLSNGRRPSEVILFAPADLGRIVVAAVFGGMFAGAVDSLAIHLDGASTLSGWDVLAIAGPAHVAWTLLAASALLPVSRERQRAGRVESVALAVALLGVLALLRLESIPVSAIALSIPIVVLAALRGSVRGTTLHLLALGTWVSVLTTAHRGPFALPDEVTLESLGVSVVGQGYVVVTAMMALPLAVATAQGSLLRRELRSERDLSEMTLATAGCLVLVTDLKGSILRVNTAATRVLGVDAATLLGTPAWGLVPREHRSVARRMFAAPDGSFLPESVEGRLVDHTGEERRVLWTTGIVRDHADSPTHLVLTGLDVTAELNAAGHTEHLLRAPIDTAIIGIDRQGRITLANAGAEAVLGSNASDLVGSPFIRVLSAAELAEWAGGLRIKPDFASLLAQTVDAGPRDWHWLGDGTATLVSMELSQIVDNSGTLIGYLCVANDVTEIRTRQQLLVDALDTERHVVDRLRELDATKDHFVTTVSHELRTPVATIVGYTEMLTAGELGDLTPAQIRAMEAVNRNGERLVTLVDNLLALAGPGPENAGSSKVRVDLVDLAKEAERQAGALLQGRRLSAIFSFPGRPVPVSGDRRQLALVLSNLLSNSVKFTEDGGEIRCTVVLDGEDAVLEVTDNGLGIPEDEQDQVFTRFWRSRTAIDRHIQGTGLGLATAQAIVTAHGGSVTLESTHLDGTTARVRLPLLAEPTLREEGPRPERVRRDRSGPIRPNRPGLPELTRRSSRGPEQQFESHPDSLFERPDDLDAGREAETDADPADADLAVAVAVDAEETTAA
ncbi:ATP-binding protein, partial [Nocardioides yefusunii]